MRFLRRSGDKVESAWVNDKFDARDKAHAIFVLGDVVKIARHPYDRDPGSGSGNCWCGRDKSNRIHHIVRAE